MYDKWNHICNHLLLYHFLLITVPEIPYCMRVSIKFCWIPYSISYSLLLLLSLSCLLLDYLQLYYIFLIAASVTIFHISYNYWVSYCLGLVVPISQRSFNSVCYYFLLSTPIGMYSHQLFVSGPSIFLVIVPATPLSYSYQHTVSAIRSYYQLVT